MKEGEEKSPKKAAPEAEDASAEEQEQKEEETPLSELAQAQEDLLNAERMVIFFSRTGNEEDVRPFREHEEELREKVHKLERNGEIEKLKNEIAELNGITQRQEALATFGKDHGFSREKTYAFIEERVKENEDRIRALEQGSARKAPQGREKKNGGPPEGGEVVEGEIVSNGDEKKRAERAEVIDAEVVAEGEEKKKEAPKTPEAAETVLDPKITKTTAKGEVIELTPAEIIKERETRVERKEDKTLSPVVAKEFREAYFGANERKGGAKENEKKKSWRGWGWVKERLKGFGTMGFWEIHQAERFRSSKKAVGQDIEKAAVDTIQKVTHLDLKNAMEEAFAMRVHFEEVGIEKPTRDDYERMSKRISGMKEQTNNQAIEKIVGNSSKSLGERLKKYKNEFGEKVLVTAGDRKKLEDEMRKELTKLQDGETEADAKKFSKVIRDTVDPAYWKRYVYGGLEMALDALALKVVISKIAAEKLVLFTRKASQVAKTAADAGGGGPEIGFTEAPGDMFPPDSGDEFMNMKTTVWDSSREWLRHHGVGNPSNQQIMEVAKQVCQDNGIGVKEWGIEGNPMDRGMKAGHLLKFSGALGKLNLIRKVATVGYRIMT